MKKSNVIFTVGLVIILISALGVLKNPTKVEKITTESSTESIASNIVTEGTTEVKEEENVVYTKEMANSVQEYLTKYTSMDVIQQMSNGNASGVKYTDMVYELNCDTKNKIIQTKITDNSSDKPTSSYYLDCVKDDLHFIKKKAEDNWEEAKGKTVVLDCDIKKYKNAYSLYKYLLNDNKLKEGAEGTVSDKYYYFEVVEPATKDMISGVEYDKLGNHTVTHIFMSEDGKQFIPVSVIVTVDFTIGEEKYDVTSTVQFISINNNELQVPDLNKKESDSNESN